MAELHNRAGHHLPTGETSVAIDVVFSTLDDTGHPTERGVQRLTRVVEGPRFHDVLDTTLRPAESRLVRLRLDAAILDAAHGAQVAVRYMRYANLPAVRARAEQRGLSTTVEIGVVTSSWPDVSGH